MNVQNRTDGKHLALPMKDRDGNGRLVVIAKYTYRATARGALERDTDGADPHPIDIPNGDDPAKSSIKIPSDVFEHKPGTDVLLVADAHPRAQSGATHVDVSLRMGPIQKTVRAHGLRVWQRGMLSGVTPGPALALREPVPIIYELAWGGVDVSNPEKPLAEPRNHLGRGIARDPGKLVGQAASQLELPEKANVPASFGAIHRHWAPRAGFAGTYDRAWMDTRMPLLPLDFDARFNVCVPHDQWSAVPLAGDEPIEILNATEGGAWRIQLPRESPAFSSIIAGERRTHATHLDTVVIDARERRIELTWRVSILSPPKLEMIDEVRIVPGRS